MKLRFTSKLWFLRVVCLPRNDVYVLCHSSSKDWMSTTNCYLISNISWIFITNGAICCCESYKISSNSHSNNFSQVSPIFGGIVVALISLLMGKLMSNLYAWTNEFRRTETWTPAVVYKQLPREQRFREHLEDKVKEKRVQGMGNCQVEMTTIPLPPILRSILLIYRFLLVFSQIFGGYFSCSSWAPPPTIQFFVNLLKAIT